MKALYKLKIDRVDKVEERTTNEDGSYTVKEVDKVTPHTVTFKLPSRRESEEISIVYNSEYGQAIKRGLQTADVLRRSLIDNGGIMSDDERQRLFELDKEITRLKNEIVEAEINKTPLEDKFQELQGLLDELQILRKPQEEIFSRTAEYYAQHKTIEWCCLNLSFYENGDAVFPGVSTDAKLNKYYDWCDQGKDFPQQVFNKALLCYYHHIIGKQTDEKYFDALMNEVGDTV